MNAVTTFFRDHWKIMLIGLFGVALGIFGNMGFGLYQNRQLLATLNEELKSLESKSILTEEQKEQLQRLRGEIYILKFKC